MRKLLNNPKVVLPLALFALLWAVHSYGVLEDILPKFGGANPRSSSVAPALAESKKEMEISVDRRVMQSLDRERWLPKSWAKFTSLRNEPFVANHSFGREAAVEAPTEKDPVVVVDADSLDSYIADHLGLDAKGFFVRFDTVFKRPGDLLLTTDGRQLRLGAIAIAERQRSEAAHISSVASVLSGMRLYGVVSGAAAPEGSQASVPADELANQEASGVDAESNPGADSAFIEGGIKPEGIYRQGDILNRDPVLGLSFVGEDRVEIVDRHGNVFSLEIE